VQLPFFLAPAMRGMIEVRDEYCRGSCSLPIK
jgi:hypothetical protein